MIIKWLDHAIYDLYVLRKYISADNPIAAEKMAVKILRTVELLLIHPEMGRVGRIEGTRELIISHTPYIISYYIRENIIEILRVLHGAQLWPATF